MCALYVMYVHMYVCYICYVFMLACSYLCMYVCMYVCNGLIPFGSRVLEPNYKFFETFKFKPNRLRGFKLKHDT